MLTYNLWKKVLNDKKSDLEDYFFAVFMTILQLPIDIIMFPLELISLGIFNFVILYRERKEFKRRLQKELRKIGDE